MILILPIFLQRNKYQLLERVHDYLSSKARKISRGFVGYQQERNQIAATLRNNPKLDT
jgi:hypothetical protein